MNVNFHDVSDISKITLADAPLVKECDLSKVTQMGSFYERSIVCLRERSNFLPRENGEWEGKPGESKWIPDPDYIPKKQNPEGKTWGEIFEKYGIDGTVYKDGYPDFSEISKGTVEIEDFSTDRDDNFDKADIALAKQRGCTPEEVKKWREENGYTWHECEDMKTMQKVPSEVHNNIPHCGGVSEKKKQEAEQ